MRNERIENHFYFPSFFSFKEPSHRLPTNLIILYATRIIAVLMDRKNISIYFNVETLKRADAPMQLRHANKPLK